MAFRKKSHRPSRIKRIEDKCDMIMAQLSTLQSIIRQKQYDEKQERYNKLVSELKETAERIKESSKREYELMCINHGLKPNI